MSRSCLISEGRLSPQSLDGEVVVVTGAGRGIGLETARALLWLGAKVAIAEIDPETGERARSALETEFGPDRVCFLQTDVSCEADVDRLADQVRRKWDRVTGVINNATVFPIGTVQDVPTEAWERSFRVNLLGPVLLARKFLPEMVRRKHGIFVCVSSSGAAPYMGAYEVFKTAQVELASTIASEVEGSGVYAFTIGPGIVRTPGFIDGGGKVAALMGTSLEALVEMNRAFELTPEAAGAGFAASIVLAQKYHGGETSSTQVLRDAGITAPGHPATAPGPRGGQLSDGSDVRPRGGVGFADLCGRIEKTYQQQAHGWKTRGVFQRQWIARDVKKNTGLSIDELGDSLRSLSDHLTDPAQRAASLETLQTLLAFYHHQESQLRGYEADPEQLRKGLATIAGWVGDITTVLQTIDPPPVVPPR